MMWAKGSNLFIYCAHFCVLSYRCALLRCCIISRCCRWFTTFKRETLSTNDWFLCWGMSLCRNDLTFLYRESRQFIDASLIWGTCPYSLTLLVECWKIREWWFSWTYIFSMIKLHSLLNSSSQLWQQFAGWSTKAILSLSHSLIQAFANLIWLNNNNNNNSKQNCKFA